MNLVSAVLARDEAGEDRYLKRVLSRCLAFSDTVVLLDDRSDDSTPDIAREMGCVVRTRAAIDRAWGAESSARRELWDFASEYCPDVDSWILICDADQELVGDVRSLCRSEACNSWAFVLFDLWSETEYRTDGPWVGHASPRPWLFAPHRVPPNWTADWSARGLHIGHAPQNFPLITAIAPPDTHYWLHYSYMRPEHRQAKYNQYLAHRHLLSPAEVMHAESILA